MSSANASTMDRSSSHSGSSGRYGGCWGKKGNWSGFNIGAMVLGFVFFWPIGLVILYWILKGNDVKDLPAAIKHQVSRLCSSGVCEMPFGESFTTDNAVFNAYQQTQIDRIKEIKEEIKTRSRRFNEFRADARRRADEEEFNRFMASAPTSD